MAEVGVEKRTLEENRYKGIDIFKFIMAILVVMIHAQPFTSVNETLNQIVVDCIARIAVPFFFVASGFLLWSKEDTYADRTKKYCIRMLKLYFMWSAIYLPINLYECVTERNMGLAEAALDILRRTFFSGSYMQLWYLLALVVAVVLIELCEKRKMTDRMMLVFGTVIYIIGLSYQCLHGFFVRLPFMKNENVVTIIDRVVEFIDTTRNGVFFGFLFVLIGRFFAKGKIKISLKNAVVGLIISILCGIVETQYLINNKIAWDRDMWLFLPFATMFLFAIASQIKSSIDIRWCKFLRQASVIIFLVHVIYEVMYRAVGVKLVGGVYHSVAAFGFVLVMSLLTVYVVRLLEQCKWFAWIGKLFG